MILLREKMKARGHGTMASIQRTLELGPTFFSDKRRSLDVGVVLQVLGELGIRPADFFQEIEETGREDEAMPAVPPGAETIAEYYLEGKHLEEEPG
ncbi:MAG: hypothetical protein GY719_43230 [bacterium]|nr:hypothetical protein [bacterium]